MFKEGAFGPVSTIVFTALALVLLCIPAPSRAADLLSRIVDGKDQETLILGETRAAVGGLWDIKVLFIFPQSHDTRLSVGDVIQLGELKKNISFSNDIERASFGPRKRFLFSLNKEGEIYVPAWGIYEIEGEVVTRARLVYKNTPDDEALEYFIRSQGLVTQFSFERESIYAVTESGKTQIYPKVVTSEFVRLVNRIDKEYLLSLPWSKIALYGAPFFFMILLILRILLRRKKFVRGGYL